MVKENTSHPPGPYGHPLMGNLNELRLRVLDFFCSLQQQYGDITTIRFSIRKVSYLQHPDLIQHVLQENNRNYTKSLRYEQLKYLLGNGLLTSEGEFWLRQRRMIQPAFHKQRLQLWCDDMVLCTQSTLDHWERKFTGQKVNIASEMMALTLQIVGKTLLSADVKSDAKNMADALSFLLRAVNVRTRTPILLPLWIPTAHHLKIKKSVKVINNILDKVFKDRRRNPVERYDLLSMLMESTYEDNGEHMDNRQLRDEVMTIFVAGHETTANALSWTLYLLARHPEELKKCRDEAEQVLHGEAPTFSKLRELKYLLMVIDESMRIYPPAWMIGRKTIKNDVIGNYKIAPGHNVLISPYALHRDKRYWPEPEKFRPLRFTAEEVKKRPKFAYLPYGGGPRVCIGNNFATMEIQIVLTMIIQRFHFEMIDDKEVLPDALITLRPKDGVWMKLKLLKQHVSSY